MTNKQTEKLMLKDCKDVLTQAVRHSIRMDNSIYTITYFDLTQMNEMIEKIESFLRKEN